MVLNTIIIASFQCATKNRKERGEPGKIYHVRNVIGRESLITCGQMNKLAHTSLTARLDYACSVVKAMLRGSAESYGECTQTHDTRLPDKLTAIHPGEWLLNTKAGPALS